MNISRLKISIVFSILAIGSISNILDYSFDGNYIAFGKPSEEFRDETRAWEEKNQNINPKDHGGEKIAIITLDDGEKGQIEYAKPILDKYGFPATFFIICNYVSEGNEEGDNAHMSWSDILLLQSGGYEIGSHTMNHDDLDELSEEQAEKEVVDSKKCLENNGVKKVRAFSYPFNGGYENEAIVSKVAENYEIARTATDPLAFLDAGYDKYAIMGWSHDSEREEYPSDEDMLKRFVEVVESQSEHNSNGNVNAIPVLVYHNIGHESSDYTTSIELFESEMDYLKENGFKVISLSDLI
ncbi:MAG TPA: polysaccharide deacetylase family protein [Phototrophicaceae bacterium]|nr:polysaccharide deacetylase family protein [Phototrophicaceae bacterium]